jgi:hypothetical protein
MTKKLLIGGLIVALIGVLAVGIYNYAQGNSNLRAGQALAQGNSGDRGHRGGLSESNDTAGDGSGNQGYRSGPNEGDVASGPGNRGQAYGKGQTGNVSQSGYGDGTGVPNPQANVSEWLTFGGEVVSVDMTSLTLQTDDGQVLSVQLGPEWFWSGQGVSLVPGEHVTVLGFEENGQFQVGQIIPESSGTALQLRDSDGRPLWAGRGRGGH